MVSQKSLNNLRLLNIFCYLHHSHCGMLKEILSLLCLFLVLLWPITACGDDNTNISKSKDDEDNDSGLGQEGSQRHSKRDPLER